MNRLKITLNGALAFAVLAGMMTLMLADAAAADICVGNGHSELADPQQAGKEAATKAKAALGEQEAKVVLVFDESIVYGCAAYAPITQDCNTGTVGVLALGGDIKAVAATAEVEDSHETCGKKIGEGLKAAGVPETGGRVVLLWGACHVPANDALVGGVCGVLGEKFPVAGGAAFRDLLYVQGKVLPESNLGLMLCGDFRCGFSAKNAPANDKERAIAVAGEAAEAALGQRKDKAVLVLAFDCGGRRGQMGGSVDRELQLIKDAAGDTPIFGFYGSGEIGPKDNDSPPHGVGHHIVICAILGT